MQGIPDRFDAKCNLVELKGKAVIAEGRR